jgi:uncharacterized protein YndB with AHSA1/START domain
VTNESILISEVIPATPQRIFTAWMDSAEHSAFTGDEATVVPEVGGEHRAAGGYIQGRTLELNEGSRIVQSWRTTEFPPESPDSRVEITLEPTLGGTLVTLLHTDIPVGQGDRYRQGWNEYYLSRMKSYFADGDQISADLTEMRAEATADDADDDDTELEVEVADADVIDIRPTNRAPARKTAPGAKTNARTAAAVTASPARPAVKAAARRASKSRHKVSAAKTPKVAARSPKVAARRTTGRTTKLTTKRTTKRATRPSTKNVAKRHARKPAARATMKPVVRKAARRKPAKKSVKAAARRPTKKIAKAASRKSAPPTSRKSPTKSAKSTGAKAKGGSSARSR